jgi:hypothetical protein
MGLKDVYLIGYNNACAVGWAMVWVLAVKSVFTGLVLEGLHWKYALANVYAADGVAFMLKYSQMAAVLEIVHAIIGLVRSPILVTTMQVMSRVVALVAILNSVAAQSKWTKAQTYTLSCTYSSTSMIKTHFFFLFPDQWGAGVMILSWSSVEVPRYLFYVAALVTGDSTKKTPFPLFWMRYSLFAILYPTGIFGEVTVFFRAAIDPDFATLFGDGAALFYGWILPVVYLYGSPFMIYNMVANRKSAFKKRFAKPPPPPRGLCWPADKKGERSSTDTNKAILAAALGAVSKEKSESVLSCKKWRFQYVKYLRALVEEQCKSPEAALAVAQAGLDKAYELFEFIYPDGKAVSLKEAMEAKNSESFYTKFIQGEKQAQGTQIEVPYKGTTLSGQALKDQVKKWVDYGTIEPSAGEAIVKCVDNPEWLKDVSKRHFVLLGAGSAMGPLHVLLSLGANVVAIDLDRPAIWKRLIGLAKNSPGSITFPVKVDPATCKTDEELYENAGCNLFTHTPMIRDWLLNLYPGKPFTVGSYAYLDGALHVQVSLAMDAICRDLSENRKDTSLAYLCTPTDLHLIPKEAYDAQIESYKVYSKKLYCMFLNTLSRGKFLRKNAKPPVPGAGGDFFLVNGISVAQGPNYALAKRMQHWRAIIARSKGCIVSSNIAPSTSTVSVVHNRTFAWAYEGMPYFKPFEIFAPETSNAVMSALLFFDLNEPKSVGNPKTSVANPNQLFSFGSFHGGVWRCAYEIDSIGEASVFLYFYRVASPYLYVGGAACAAAAALFFKSA